jgi:hypothetical protein
MVVKVNGDQLRKIAALVASGRVKVSVAKVFPLKEVGEAHLCLENNHIRGKVILAVSPRWFDLDARSNESAGRPSEENAIYARANIPGVTPFV